jgi:hypothetical protein
MFQHLDSVLAFAAVMLAASLVVTAATQLVISLLGLRGANLRRSLADLFENASDDRDARRYARVIAGRVLRQPLVSGSVFSRFGIRPDDLPFVPADAAGKLRWAGSGIPLQPWLLGAVTGTLFWPGALFVIKRLFALDFCAYAGVITSYIPFLNLCDHPWRSGAIVGAVAGGLLSRCRLATAIRLDELVSLLERLSAPAGGTLPDPAQRAMLVIAGETRNRARPKINTASAQMERMFRDASDEGEGGVAVAVEKAVSLAPAAVQAETRVEGLNLWFEHAMERASQRFTAQARVITVVLSAVLVFAAHFDAIRLFQSLSSDGQVRAQLASSADALARQAEQLPRAKEGSRTVVPDVYRSSMAAVLEAASPPSEQPKSKARHSSHGTAAPSASESERASGNGAAPNEIQISATAPQSPEDALQATPAVAQVSPETPVKQHKGRSAKLVRVKAPENVREKPVAVSAEDRAAIEAKSRARKALETQPGFASREDADLWLRETLNGDPAAENLAAAYEQEVNSQLPGEADRLIDHSASIKRELARTRFQLIPETWPDSMPNSRELPGLLVAVALLSLGASLCYNLLMGVASLRPLRNIK